MKFFELFPKINYSNTSAINLLTRTSFTEDTLNNINVFLPLTLKEGERPEHIGNDLYGYSDAAWLVFYSNEIIDPYYDWYLSSEQFDQFIVKKYGSIGNAQSNVVFYENISNSDIIITQDTYSLSSNTQDWNAVDAYTYELTENEKRKFIKTVSPTYLKDIETTLRDKIQE